MKKSRVLFAALFSLGLYLLGGPNIFCPANLHAADFHTANLDAADFSAPANVPAPAEISTRDYGVFLNSTAASDPHHLYDWKMADGSWQIVRSGMVGNYCYQAGGWKLEVASAEKNTPMFFLSDADAEQYSIFSKTNFSASCSSDVIDEELHVSDVSFVIAAAKQSSGVGAVAVGLSSGDVVGESLGFAAIVVEGAAGEFLNGEIPNEEFSDEERSVHSSAIENEHKNNALENHDRSLMNDLLTDAAGSRLDSHFEATAMNVTPREGSLDGVKIGKIFSSDISGKTGGETGSLFNERRPGKVFSEDEKTNVRERWKKDVKRNVIHRHAPFPNKEIVAGLRDLPDVLLRQEIPSYHASGFGNYKQECQKKYSELLEDFKATNPEIHALLLTWQSTYETWISNTIENNKLDLSIQLMSIEWRLPLKARTAAAFYHAAGLMEIFDEFQKKSFEALKNQKQKDLSFLLATIARNGELMDKATAQIKTVLEIIKTCKARRLEPNVQPRFVQFYEDIAYSAFRLFYRYECFANMKDAPSMSKKRDAMLKVLEYKLQASEEIIVHGEGSELVRERVRYLCTAFKIAMSAIEDFEKAIKAKLPQEKNAWAKKGDYGLLEAEELAANGISERLIGLDKAGIAAKNAANAFGWYYWNNFEKGEYYMKQAEIYAEQGSEAGDAFTFEKFQRLKNSEKDEEESSCTVM